MENKELLHDIVAISDHAHYYKCSSPSKDLLIVFSALHTPKGKFLGSNIFTQDRINILFLNCEGDWYLNGIPGFSSSIPGTVDAIRALIAREIGGLGTLVTFGGSMGGYGALLYGSLLDATYSVSFGAETILSVLGGISRPFVNNKKYNLKKIIAASKTKVRAFYGELFIPDVLCALTISTLDNVLVQTVKNKEHPLPAYFHRKYDLRTLAAHYVQGEEFLVDADDRGCILEYPELIKFCFAAKCAALKGHTSSLLAITDIVQKRLPACADRSVRSSVHYTLALCHETAREKRRAVDHAAQAVLNAENASTLNVYARCLRKLDDPRCGEFAQKAIAAHVPGILHEPVDAYDIMFTHYFRSRADDQARAVATAAIEAMPRQLKPRIWLIQLLNREGDIAGALKEAQSALRLHASNASLHLHLGNLFSKNGNLAKAEEHFRTSIQLNPEAVAPYIQLSQLYGAQNKNEEAIALLRQAIALLPEATPLYVHLGMFFFTTHQFDDAEQALNNALARDPTLPRPSLLLSHVSVERGDLDTAIRHAREAIAKEPASAHNYHHLGNLLSRTGDAAGAREAEKKAIARDPGNAEYHFRLSQLYAQGHDIGLAIEKACDAITRNHTATQYYTFLGKLLERAGAALPRPDARETPAAPGPDVP